MLVDIEVLQQYIDGELPPAPFRAVEAQIAADANLARLLAELRQQRALRAQVWEGYTPSAAEARDLAARCMAELRQQEFAPLKLSSAPWTFTGGLRRSALAAACLIIGIGGYAIGRASTGAYGPTSSNTTTHPTQYVVRIELPGGESVRQTFTDYAAAHKFANSYLADHAATAQGGTEQVAVLQPQGVF